MFVTKLVVHVPEGTGGRKGREEKGREEKGREEKGRKGRGKERKKREGKKTKHFSNVERSLSHPIHQKSTLSLVTAQIVTAPLN